MNAMLKATRNEIGRQKRAADRPTQALCAIIRHERAKRAVDALSKAIGEELRHCSIYQLAHESEHEFGHPGPDTASLWTGDGKVMTHLWHAYHDVVEAAYDVRGMDADQQRTYLVDTDCPHCLKAWEDIEMRRLARKELGAAKSAIRAIGRAELGKEG